jgi:hypothetical protein
MSVSSPETRPVEAKANCGLSMRKSSVYRPVSSRRTPPRECGLAGKERVDCGLPDPQVGGAAGEPDIEAAAGEEHLARRAHVDRTGEIALGEAREGREVADPGRELARVDEVVDRSRGEDREVRPADPDPADLDRGLGRQGDVGNELEALAQCLAQRGVFGLDAGGRAFENDRYAALRGVLQVLGEPPHHERHVRELDVCGAQTLQHEMPVPAAALAVGDPERARAQAGLRPGHRQGHGLALRIPEVARKLQAFEEAVGPERKRALEGEDGARHPDLVDTQAPGLQARAGGAQPGSAGEEVAVLGGHEGRELAREVGDEGEAFGRLAQRHVARDEAHAVRVEGEFEVQVLERALALEPEVDRRAALDVERGRDDPARRLAKDKVELELAPVVGEGGAQAELTARVVEARDTQAAVEGPADQRERARGFQAGRLAKHRLAQAQLLHAQPYPRGPPAAARAG